MEMILPNNLLGVATTVILGIFGFIALWDRISSQKKKDVDAADDRLIDLLQGQIKALDVRVKEGEDESKRNKIELEKLKSENGMMKEILQGRDGQMTEFMKRGFASMDKVPVIIEMIGKTNKHIERLAVAIEKKA